jgi:hypothetical protein
MDEKSQLSNTKKLYKYVSLSSWDLENISKHQVFMRTATLFNDVFDSTSYYNRNVFNIPLKDHIDKNGMSLPDSLNADIHTI